jgi:hypothetical protein
MVLTVSGGQVKVRANELDVLLAVLHADAGSVLDPGTHKFIKVQISRLFQVLL